MFFFTVHKGSGNSTESSSMEMPGQTYILKNNTLNE